MFKHLPFAQCWRWTWKWRLHQSEISNDICNVRNFVPSAPRVLWKTYQPVLIWSSALLASKWWTCLWKGCQVNMKLKMNLFQMLQLSKRKTRKYDEAYLTLSFTSTAVHNEECCVSQNISFWQCKAEQVRMPLGDFTSRTQREAHWFLQKQSTQLLLYCCFTHNCREINTTLLLIWFRLWLMKQEPVDFLV